MSMASPTRRSSSSTVPGPSFNSSPTSILERPSTAETCTGTSNTASRSAAMREACSSSLYARSSIGGASAELRSGSGTCASVSLMVQSSWPLRSGLIPGRQIASDEFANLRFDGRAFQHYAAVGPFDPAVAGGDAGLGQDHQPALEAALGGLPFDLLAGGLVELVVDADDEMRGCDQMREAVADERGDFAERLAGDQFAAQLARHGDRDFDRLGFHPGLDAGETRGDAADGDADLFQRQRRTAVTLHPCLVLGCLVTGAVGTCLGFRDLLRDLDRRCGTLARLVRRREVRVEQEFCGRCHQYTSSSSARFLVSVISPLAAMSLARLTSSACASSTSRNRTGPIAAMSSISILPAREDMLPRKKARTSSLALFSAMPSLSLSTLRISV